MSENENIIMSLPYNRRSTHEKNPRWFDDLREIPECAFGTTICGGIVGAIIGYLIPISGTELPLVLVKIAGCEAATGALTGGIMGVVLPLGAFIALLLVLGLHDVVIPERKIVHYVGNIKISIEKKEETKEYAPAKKEEKSIEVSVSEENTNVIITWLSSNKQLTLENSDVRKFFKEGETIYLTEDYLYVLSDISEKETKEYEKFQRLKSREREQSAIGEPTTFEAYRYVNGLLDFVSIDIVDGNINKKMRSFGKITIYDFKEIKLLLESNNNFIKWEDGVEYGCFGDVTKYIVTKTEHEVKIYAIKTNCSFGSLQSEDFSLIFLRDKVLELCKDKSKSQIILYFDGCLCVFKKSEMDMDITINKIKMNEYDYGKVIDNFKSLDNDSQIKIELNSDLSVISVSIAKENTIFFR